MKKRILSLLLAALTLVSLCVPVFASEEPEEAAEEIEAVEEIAEAPEIEKLPDIEEAPAAEEDAAVEETPAVVLETADAAEETPAVSAASDVVASGNCGALTWKFTSNGTLTISGTGPMTSTDWFDTLNKLYPDDTHAELTSFAKKVVIEPGVTSICDGAFWGYYKMTSVSIPNTVTSIGSNAFQLTGLTSVVIPNSVTELGEYAFYGSSLTSVTIGSGVTVIPEMAFYGCDRLTSVTVPSTVTGIGSTAFGMCTNMTITILNPQCKISDDSYTLGAPGVNTVCGYTGSTAEAFAKKYGYTFQALDNAGTSQKSGWQKENGKWYYYKDGAKATGIVTVSGKNYYMDASGAMQTGWISLANGDYYYANSSGVLQTGWVKLSGKYYYLDPTTFLMERGGTRVISGKTYYFANGGAMGTGWINLGGGDYYYANSSGALQTGWVKSGKTYYYMDPTTFLMERNGTRTVSGATYYFNNSGVMKTGWISLGNGDYYYAASSGALYQNKWLKSGGKWYYMGEDFKMLRNVSRFIDGTYYTFTNAGVMKTGSAVPDSAWGPYAAKVKELDGLFNDRYGIYPDGVFGLYDVDGDGQDELLAHYLDKNGYSIKSEIYGLNSSGQPVLLYSTIGGFAGAPRAAFVKVTYSGQTYLAYRYLNTDGMDGLGEIHMLSAGTLREVHVLKWRGSSYTLDGKAITASAGKQIVNSITVLNSFS